MGLLITIAVEVIIMFMLMRVVVFALIPPNVTEDKHISDSQYDPEVVWWPVGLALDWSVIDKNFCLL